MDPRKSSICRASRGTQEQGPLAPIPNRVGKRCADILLLHVSEGKKRLEFADQVERFQVYVSALVTILVTDGHYYEDIGVMLAIP